ITTVCAKRKQLFLVGCELEVGVNDGEDAVFRHHAQKARRDDVNSGEGKSLHLVSRAGHVGGLVAFQSPAAKVKLIVEKQVPRTFALLHGQCRQRSLFDVELHHAVQVNRTEDIHIVQEERLIPRGGVVKKEPGGFFQPAAGVKQDIFAGDLNPHAEVAVRLQIGK